MPRSVPKWHTNGHGKGREGVWRGNGGGTEGERRGPGGFEDHLQCAILAHNPLLVSNVNQQSIPQQPLLAHDQSCDSLSHSSLSSANSNRADPTLKATERVQLPGQRTGPRQSFVNVNTMSVTKRRKDSFSTNCL